MPLYALSRHQHADAPVAADAAMNTTFAACIHLNRRDVQAKGYQIDYDDWHAHVHGVLPYDRCLAPDERLRAIIKARPTWFP